jgi:hypothetical protein
MSTTPILGITEVAQNQNNRYITINNAIAALEQAGNSKLDITISGTTAAVLTADQCRRYAYYEIDGATGNFDVTFMGQPDTVNDANRLFVVKNTTAYTATIESDAAGTTVAVAAGYAALIHQSGDNMVRILHAPGTTVPYDVGFSVTGLPTDGAECLHFVAARAIDFPDNFSGAYGHCGVNPTATASFDLKKNGVSIGSISINTSGVFTFNTTGAGTSLAAGDRLTVHAPSPQDATLSDVGVTFAGTRTI